MSANAEKLQRFREQHPDRVKAVERFVRRWMGMPRGNDLLGAVFGVVPEEPNV